jgi:ABC-type branched-subunit amino acid transport system substrate-binding protein
VLFHEYNLENEGALGLSRILRKDQDNVFIIPSATEAQVSVAVTNLNAVAENYPVTLIGLSNFQRYKSIQTEYYHHVHMNLLSPYYVDYQSPVVNRFIRKFRSNYSAEPSQYSDQGYDVAFYFMSALFNYGKDFIDCLPYHQVDLTQGEFHFEKVNRNGGYMNGGLFILRYEPDYSIRMKGVIGRPFYQISETK